jgi:hypothetical protein
MDTIRPEVTGRHSGSKVSPARIGHAHEVGGQGLKPLGVSIKQAAEITSESEWQVKERLRRGEYRAKKSGRRTIIDYQSIEDHWHSLPDWTNAKLPASEKALAAAVVGRARQRAAKRAAAVESKRKHEAVTP